MTEPQLPELALTEEEVGEILRSCKGRALLVGGQALAFWAQHYDVTPLGVLGANVTSDVDFLGDAQVARELAEDLKAKGWRFWRATADDGTTQTTKLSKRIEGQGIKQIDFLGSMVGLDSERVKRRAVTLHLSDGARLQVLHPLDVLDSRLRNLASLPSKRNSQGIAQAHLAIDITRCYLEQLVREDNTRLLLKAIEYVVRIAQDRSLDPVFHELELNPLVSVPVEQVPFEEFRMRRWPQVLALFDEQRRAYASRQQRKALRKKAPR
jgi:hypothetical protein